MIALFFQKYLIPKSDSFSYRLCVKQYFSLALSLCALTITLRNHHISADFFLNEVTAWMNNCIGFYNHRYFIMFCVFMWLGTLYVCFTSFDLFTYHFFHPGVSKICHIILHLVLCWHQVHMQWGTGDRGACTP